MTVLLIIDFVIDITQKSLENTMDKKTNSRTNWDHPDQIIYEIS